MSLWDLNPRSQCWSGHFYRDKKIYALLRKMKSFMISANYCHSCFGFIAIINYSSVVISKNVVTSQNLVIYEEFYIRNDGQCLPGTSIVRFKQEDACMKAYAERDSCKGPKADTASISCAFFLFRNTTSVTILRYSLKIQTSRSVVPPPQPFHRQWPIFSP